MVKRYKILIFIFSVFIISCGNKYEKLAKNALECGDYNRAIKFANIALDKNPKNSNSRLILAKAYIQKLSIQKDVDFQTQKKYYSSAFEQFNIYSRLNPNDSINREISQLYFNYAISLLAHSDTITAIKKLNSAIKVDKKNILAYSWLGFLYYKFKYYNQAKDYYLAIIAIDSSNVNAYYNLSVLMNILGEYVVADEYLKKYQFLTTKKR